MEFADFDSPGGETAPLPPNAAAAPALGAQTALDGTPADLPNYRLGRELGRGGMSVVYAATDLRTGQEVAVKLLYPYYTGDRDLVSRLRREVEVLRRMQHRNIIRYLASGERHGCCYYIMEYLRGETLEQRLDREGVPEIEATQIMLEVARGLAEAHARQIFHRDVKPGNIFLCVDGTVKLVDFGLAKDESDSYQTQLGLIVGTPLYLSPEQARGERSIDGRTDIYSLGISFFHALTGKVPFDDLTIPLILTKKTVEAIPNVRELECGLSPAVADIVAFMCERDIHLRYPAMPILIRDLERHLAGEPPIWPHEAARSRTLVTAHSSPIPGAGLLDDPVLQAVLADAGCLAEALDFPADQVIFYEGDTSKEVYLLAQGQVEALKAGIRVAVIDTPGTFFGEMSGLLGLPRSTTIRATRPTAAIRIDHATFERFLQSYPALGFRLSRMLAERLQRTTNDYYDLRSHYRQVVRQLNVVRTLLGRYEENQ